MDQNNNGIPEPVQDMVFVLLALLVFGYVLSRIFVFIDMLFTALWPLIKACFIWGGSLGLIIYIIYKALSLYEEQKEEWRIKNSTLRKENEQFKTDLKEAQDEAWHLKQKLKELEQPLEKKQSNIVEDVFNRFDKSKNNS